MDFPTSAAYPLSFEETSLLLDEMQRQSSEMEASRDEAEEGYEINLTADDTFEISAADTWDRNNAVGGEIIRKKGKPDRQSSRSSRGSRSSSYGMMMDAPLSPHIDTNALPIADPPVGRDPDDGEYLTAEEGSSIMDTLSDLADGVDFELDTVKGLLYKVKRERDTYKRSNHALQQSLSEAIALRSDLEAEHRQALDVILCTANDEKRRLEHELKSSHDSKRKLKMLVSEMIEEKSELENQLKQKDEELKTAKATKPTDADAQLKEERSRHYDALSDAITDLEAKFELDMQEVIKEKDEELEAKEKEHKQAVAKLESILNDAMEEKDAEMKKAKHSHSMVVKALEEEKLNIKEELKLVTGSLNQLKEEHAMSDDVHDMEIADLRKEFEGMKSRLARQFKQKEMNLQKEITEHSEAIDELEKLLQTETMQCQALISVLATKKEELSSKDAEIFSLEKKLSERNATYTREYDRMKAHLTKMCNLVESSSADRDRAREETKKLKMEHEKQNKAQKAEIERLKRKFQDGAREMAELANCSSIESKEKSELLQLQHGGAVESSSSSSSESEKAVLLNRLETAMKERDDLASEVQRLTAANSAPRLPSCTSEEDSIVHLGDVDSGESVKEYKPTHTTDGLEHRVDSLVLKVAALESSLSEKDEEIAALNVKLELTNQELMSTLEESCKEVAALNEQLEHNQQEFESAISQKNEEVSMLNQKLLLVNQELEATLEESCNEVVALNEKLDLSQQEMEIALGEKNEQLAALEQRLELVSQERDATGTEEQDLCEYSMAKIDRKLHSDNDTEEIMLERDQLKSEVQRLEAFLEQAEVVRLENDVTTTLTEKTPMTSNEQLEEMSRLNKALAERDEQLCDYKIKVCMFERLEKEHHELTEEVFRLKTDLQRRDQTDATSPKNLNDEIVETCLSRYEKDNKSLRATLNEKNEELSRLEETLSKMEEELSEYKSKAGMYESLERERDSLRTELTTLKATAEMPDEASAAAKLGEELSNLKVEHRVEVKLLKKEHATTKTKCKLLKKELLKFGAEQKEMITAYEAERQSNTELSSSLEEMVTLLENERVVHSDQVESLRSKLDNLKLKFDRMKKKRVPIDAAFKATRILLDTYESSGLAQGKSLSLSSIGSASELQAVLSEKEAEIEVLEEELQTAKNKAAELELQLNRALQRSPDSGTLQDALNEKQTEIESLRTELKEAKVHYDELSQSYADDIEATREELTKEMGRLRQAHDDSMQAYVEAGTKYEAEISKACAKTAEKVAEIESLTQQLDDTTAELEKMKTNNVINTLQDETALSRLQQQIRDEVQLKEESLAQAQALKEELDETNSLLEQKMAEIGVLTQQLIDTKDGLDELEAQLEIHVQKDGETIQRLEQRVSDEKKLREATIEKMNSMNKEIEELQMKLTECENKSKTIGDKHVDELQQSISAYEKIRDELRASHQEVEELNTKLDYCKGKMALAQREQDQLALEATERQEELKKTREEIAHYQEKLIELQNECSYLKQSTEIASCSQREYEGEAKKYAEEIEILKKQMTAAEIKSKQVLKQEVDRLKSEFNEVITAFEKELVDTCETNASEVDRLQKKLNESRDTISLLEIQITEMKSQNKQVMDQLDEKMSVEIDLAKARKQLVEAEAVEKSLAKLQQQHESLMESFDEIKNINLDLAKTLEETESSKQELKNKLHETLVTVDNNLKAYNDLRADHDKLQKECDMLKGDATSLHSLVSSLTCEKEKLMNDIDNVEGSKSSLEQEVGKYKEHQSSLEELITSLREELETKTENIQSLQNDKSSKQQQIDALQEQSKIANGHLDEMVTYCDKLKTDFASTSASLRKEIDKQAESMKDVINALKNQLLASENEKEENRKMYESDIELQQSEVESLKRKNSDAIKDLDSLSDLVSGLKDALEEEKSNSQVLRSQFKESESERKAVMAQNMQLQDELASKYASEAVMQERIRSIEMEVSDLRPMPDKLTEMMKSENIMRERIHVLESQLKDLDEVEKKLVNAQNIETTMRDRIYALENQSKNFHMEYKNAIKRKEEEGSKLRVVLQECREKLHMLMQENERLKNDGVESVANLKAMLNEAIRSRADTEGALQESLQLLEQQKRVDIKRKGELSKLEQTVEILKSKERYLESYVASLKNQLSRGSR